MFATTQPLLTADLNLFKITKKTTQTQNGKKVPGYYMLLAVSVSAFVKDKNIYNYNGNVIKNCFCLLL